MICEEVPLQRNLQGQGPLSYQSCRYQPDAVVMLIMLKLLGSVQ